ncbi:MAG: RNA methyltransferase, partial [Lentisphaerae bacterium]|nr:RNA methyltransferase [Lentisphaerota bacterium]
PACAESMPVVVVLDRLRSAYNVGNIFRVAEATRVAKIVACGYTAAPPHPKLAKTARGCDEVVPCAVADNAATAIRALKADGYTVYAVETAQDAQMYWDCQLAFPAAIVLGNEALGIDPEALALCDAVIALPARGQKNSINVGNCAAVVLFECLRQSLAAFQR